MNKQRVIHVGETPEERRARRYAQSRAWALANPEKTRLYGRRHYQKNAEKRRENSRRYNHAHKEERAAYSRAYYRRRKQEDPDYIRRMNEQNKARQREKRAAGQMLATRKKYPPVSAFESLVRNCYRTLNQYAFAAMERDRASCGERVDAYMRQYPFEEVAERAIRRRLGQMGIYRGKESYDDCYDAGMLAYMYTMHRCAALDCDYVLPYLFKMIRIYLLCARLVYSDSYRLCRINGFREVRIDEEGAQRRV